MEGSPDKSSEKQLLLTAGPNINKTQESLSTQSPHGFERLQRQSTETTYNTCFIINLVSVAALGGFLFGYDTGVIAGAQIYFDRDWPDITDS